MEKQRDAENFIKSARQGHKATLQWKTSNNKCVSATKQHQHTHYHIRPFIYRTESFVLPSRSHSRGVHSAVLYLRATLHNADVDANSPLARLEAILARVFPICVVFAAETVLFAAETSNSAVGSAVQRLQLESWKYKTPNTKYKVILKPCMGKPQGERSQPRAKEQEREGERVLRCC